MGTTIAEDNTPRPFSALRDSGLLWLINTSVLHPRGFALALHYDDRGSEPTGWSLIGDGSEPWVFVDSTDNDRCFAAVEATFRSLGAA